MTPSWMPPLPEFPELISHNDVRRMMHDYAALAVESYKRSLKPVAYRSKMSVREMIMAAMKLRRDRADALAALIARTRQ